MAFSFLKSWPGAILGILQGIIAGRFGGHIEGPIRNDGRAKCCASLSLKLVSFDATSSRSFFFNPEAKK